MAVVAALATALAAGSPAADGGVSGRWHFSYPAPTPFRLSILFGRGEAGDSTRLLLESAEGRWEFLSTQGPSGADSEETIVDVETGERFGRRIFLGGPRRPPSCAPVRETDGCLVFAGARGERAAPLSAFVRGPDGDRLRASVRALVSERFAARLAALVPVFRRSVEFDRYGSDFLALVWPERAWRRTGEAGMPFRGPGCSFDAAFGYPCDAVELGRERKRFSDAPRR